MESAMKLDTCYGAKVKYLNSVLRKESFSIFQRNK